MPSQRCIADIEDAGCVLDTELLRQYDVVVTSRLAAVQVVSTPINMSVPWHLCHALWYCPDLQRVTELVGVPVNLNSQSEIATAIVEVLKLAPAPSSARAVTKEQLSDLAVSHEFPRLVRCFPVLLLLVAVVF